MKLKLQLESRFW